jgi:hypothetical protein
MTDIEIDRALALAIGWKRMLPNPEADGLKQCWVWAGSKWRLFSHRDWNVIGPIAARYGLLVDFKTSVAWRPNMSIGQRGKNPQEAIALAVIGAKK